MDASKDIVQVVRGGLGREPDRTPWGWDVVTSAGKKLAHYGTESEADAFAEGFSAAKAEDAEALALYAEVNA